MLPRVGGVKQYRENHSDECPLGLVSLSDDSNVTANVTENERVKIFSRNCEDSLDNTLLYTRSVEGCVPVQNRDVLLL